MMKSAELDSTTVTLYETNRQGCRLEQQVIENDAGNATYHLIADSNESYQTVTGIGGSFTEAAAQALCELSAEKRQEVIDACFSPSGARYSLTRTHIASCDFSLTNYTYAPVPGDTELEHFSIEPDRKYLLPLILDALQVTGADFKIIASPWTAPPWMKTNNTWNGGELRPEHAATFAHYFVKYIEAYQKEGIDIWGITPVNEPLGNDSNWESLHFNAKQMRDFIADHLGPTLKSRYPNISIWAYDQNRDEHLEEWSDIILGDDRSAPFVDGMAVHWYQSTKDIGAEALDYIHDHYPEKQVIHSEGCIDAMGDDEPIGSWLEEDWYWRAEASDWGYMAGPELRSQHPKYKPFFRYARDLIGGFNHGLTGWIDWNLALNTRGGPNHARNFCLAPILIDSGRDSVYYTPLYHAIAHFSRYVRPGARRIRLTGHDEELMATAFRNPDGSVIVVVFNLKDDPETYSLELGDLSFSTRIAGGALQTLIVNP